MRLTLLLVLALSLQSLSAQYSVVDSIRSTDDMYAVNPWVSVPAIALGAYASQQRLLKLQDKDRITQEELDRLNPDDVNGFDRIALRRDFSKQKQAVIESDYFFNTGQWLPFGLLIWKKYRQNWLDFTLMYLEAQVTQGLFYGYAPFGPTSIDRYRPSVYYEQSDFGSRTDGNQRNSVFSGHVSTMATGFYFTARMIDDHNPDMKGWKRTLLYTGATVPSLYGGWLRIKGVKHYPTDVLIGLGVGAFSGIMIPTFHKWWKQRHDSRLTFRPIYGAGAGGMALTLRY